MMVGFLKSCRYAGIRKLHGTSSKFRSSICCILATFYTWQSCMTCAKTVTCTYCSIKCYATVLQRIFDTSWSFKRRRGLGNQGCYLPVVVFMNMWLLDFPTHSYSLPSKASVFLKRYWKRTGNKRHVGIFMWYHAK